MPRACGLLERVVVALAKRRWLMMTMDQKLGFIRHGLTALGGVFVARGQVDDSQMGEVIGAIMVLVGFAWSLLSKRVSTQGGGNLPKTPLIVLAVLGLAAMTSGCATTPNDVEIARQGFETAKAYYQQPIKADYLVIEGDAVEWTIKGAKRVTLSGPIPAKSIYPRDQGTLQTVLDGAGDLAKTAAMGIVGYQGVKALTGVARNPTVVTTEKVVPVEGAAQ